MTTETKEFFKPLEDKMNIEFIRYNVQKQMFCPKTNVILDYRTAIMMEVYKAEKLLQSIVFSPALVDNLSTIKELMEKKLPGIVVKFMTANAKLKNDLLTILK